MNYLKHRLRRLEAKEQPNAPIIHIRSEHGDGDRALREAGYDPAAVRKSDALIFHTIYEPRPDWIP